MKQKFSNMVVVVGSTASGKTDLGIFLAKKFSGEVVNADSRQIYRGMDVATGKPVSKWQVMNGKCFVDGVRHHLFDIADPDEVITVAEWKRRAVRAIRGIFRRKKLPIVVGGTGLYIQTLVENLEIPAVPPNQKLRARLEREIEKKGIRVVYERLLKLDPDAIQVVQPTNPRRVIRAIEVCLATHRPFTGERRKGKPLFNVLEIGIDVPRKKLYERIDRRVERQMRAGLIGETQRLLKKYPQHLPAMSGIGYREITEYLEQPSLIRANGSMERELYEKLVEAIQKIKYHTHSYARQQLTWFRRDTSIRWVRKKSEATRLVNEFLKGGG